MIWWWRRTNDVGAAPTPARYRSTEDEPAEMLQRGADSINDTDTTIYTHNKGIVMKIYEISTTDLYSLEPLKKVRAQLWS